MTPKQAGLNRRAQSRGFQNYAEERKLTTFVNETGKRVSIFGDTRAKNLWRDYLYQSVADPKYRNKEGIVAFRTFFIDNEKTGKAIGQPSDKEYSERLGKLLVATGRVGSMQEYYRRYKGQSSSGEQIA